MRRSIWKLPKLHTRNKSPEIRSIRCLSNYDAVVPKLVNSYDCSDQMQKTVFASSTESLALTDKIHRELSNMNKTLDDMSKYYFDGQGKALRPALTFIMAGACNSHLKVTDEKTEQLQKMIAIICEMFHTSSLLHDDVIDHAETRRGKMSVNTKWSQASSIHAGVYILATSTKLLAQTKHPEVIAAMSRILFDLVNGEFQQMSSRDDKADRFQLYLDKTFNKTASLMANSCKSVALLALSDNINAENKHIVDMSFNYGKNIGIAFQLVDDWLDFVSSADLLGKPSAADLSLGLATAPVLFASEQYPELNKLILRKFSKPGDVETAFQLVCDSEGLQQTRMLAMKYKDAAMESMKNLSDSEDKQRLTYIADKVMDRMN